MTRLRGVLLVLGVLALLAAGALFLMQQRSTTPAPYRYERLPVADTAATPAADAAQGPALERVQVIATDDQKVLAEFDVANGQDGPVRMDWRAQVDDPLLQLSAPLEEVRELADVLKRHHAAGTPVLSWWDTGRQLQVLGTADVLFNQHLAQPLFVPARWNQQRDAVLRTEQAFWGEVDNQALKRFDTFTRALVAREDEGVRLLRSIVPDRKAILALHLRDILLLGQMHPDALAVGFQDFTDPGDVHRSVRGVHGWLRDSGQEAYAVTKLPGQMLRVVALNDKSSGDTLAARLLPFIGNNQVDVAGLTLVWRSGGFVVFELEPTASGAATAQAPQAAPTLAVHRESK